MKKQKNKTLLYGILIFLPFGIPTIIIIELIKNRKELKSFVKEKKYKKILKKA